MIRLREIIHAIEDFAPLALQADFDNAGLQYGDPDMVVNGALLTLDITEEVVDEAIANNINLIVSHHPLTIKGIKQITPCCDINRSLIKAIQHNIALYCAHTNIDSVKTGVSGRLAEKIGIKEYDILCKNSDQQTTGYGVIGKLASPMDTLEFLNHLKSSIDLKLVRHTDIITNTIETIAICGGSGSSFLSQAIQAKADVYISGDFKYHDFFLAEKKILIADIGHYESEQFTKEIFYELLIKKFSNFVVQFSTVKTNPINYL